MREGNQEMEVLGVTAQNPLVLSPCDSGLFSIIDKEWREDSEA